MHISSDNIHLYLVQTEWTERSPHADSAHLPESSDRTIHLFTTARVRRGLSHSVSHLTTPWTLASLDDLRTASSRESVCGHAAPRRAAVGSADGRTKRADSAAPPVSPNVSHGGTKRGEDRRLRGREGQLLPFLPGPDFFSMRRFH